MSLTHLFYESYPNTHLHFWWPIIFKEESKRFKHEMYAANYYPWRANFKLSGKMAKNMEWSKPINIFLVSSEEKKPTPKQFW